MKLEGKVVVVTGSARGIGKACCLRLAREGAKVVAVGRSEERGRRVTDAIREAGGEAVFVQADVSREEDCKRMIDRTIEEYGRLHILFNNAGTTSIVPIEDADEAEFDRIIGVNLKSVFFACKHAIPIMKRQKRGVILTCTSKGAVIPTKCSAISDRPP